MLRYSVSFYSCLAGPSIGSLASHVTDSLPHSPVPEPNTQATPNVTGFHQLLNFTTNLRQLGGKSRHKGSTYFVKDRQSQFLKVNFPKTFLCITFEFSGNSKTTEVLSFQL